MPINMGSCASGGRKTHFIATSSGIQFSRLGGGIYRLTRTHAPKRGSSQEDEIVLRKISVGWGVPATSQVVRFGRDVSCRVRALRRGLFPASEPVSPRSFCQRSRDDDVLRTVPRTRRTAGCPFPRNLQHPVVAAPSLLPPPSSARSLCVVPQSFYLPGLSRRPVYRSWQNSLGFPCG